MVACRGRAYSLGPVPEFTMMDYGCGPGHSALDSLNLMFKDYPQIDPRGTIAVIRHSDQSGNDWRGAPWRSCSVPMVISAMAPGFGPSWLLVPSTRHLLRRGRSSLASALPQAIG